MANVTAESMPPETSTTAGAAERLAIIAKASALSRGRRYVAHPVARAFFQRRAGMRLDHRLQRGSGSTEILERDLAVGDAELCFRSLGIARIFPQQCLERSQRGLVVLGDLVRTAQPVIRIRRQRAIRILVDEGAEAARGIDVVAGAERFERRIEIGLCSGLIGRRRGLCGRRGSLGAADTA